MILLKAYNYFFYKLYTFFESSTYSRWWSEWKAYVVMLALSLWLYNSIETTVRYIYQIPVSTDYSVIDLQTALFLISVGVFNWFLFEYNDRWKEVVKYYGQKRNDKVGGIIVWTIVLGIIIYYWFVSLPMLGRLQYE